MTLRNKLLTLIACLSVILSVMVTGTIAWLMTQTDPVTNTFTPSDIKIMLVETTGTEYKMVPGTTIAKDPVVTVEAGSENCWLFVKLEKSLNFESFMTFTMEAGWVELAGTPGVYYREVKADDAVRSFRVLQDNKVTVLDTVTKEMMNALTNETQPKLTITAYACQQEGVNSAADAWAKLNPPENPPQEPSQNTNP